MAKWLDTAPSTIIRLKKCLQETSDVGDRPRSGRPRLSTEHADRQLIRMSLTNRRLTAPELLLEWENTFGVKASTTTVKNRLLKANLRGCVAAHKPFLKDDHRSRRLS